MAAGTCRTVTRLLLCVACWLLTGVSGDLQFTLSETAASWQQASTTCDKNRGSLALLTRPAMQQQFSRDIVPAAGEQLWVGRYVAYSSLVWIYGCYGNTSLSNNVAKTSVLRENYLVTCLHECSSFPYIGMQGDLCFCLRGVPRDDARVPGINCKSVCPGEKLPEGRQGSSTEMSHCGRKDVYNSVSVYRRALQSEVELVPGAGECVQYNIGSRRWKPDTCFQRFLFTCDSRSCLSPRDQCILESSSAHTWFEARSKCEGNDGYLSVLNGTTNAYFNAKNVNRDVPFWTGLHRKEVVLWNFDKLQQSTVPSDRCVTVYKTGTGSWDYKVEPCSKSFRFACIEDYQPPGPTTQGPSTTSATGVGPTVNPNAAPVNVTAGAGHLTYSVTTTAMTILFSALMTSLSACL